jgi:guanylate kinase
VTGGRGLVNRTFPIIFAAPSGAGKTTIAERLLERRSDVVFSVSMTTRPRRAYERDGEHYRFVDEASFRRHIDRGELLEWAEVHGNLYGTPRSNVAEAVDAGRYLVLDIDIQGARQVRQSVPDAVSIFVLPPSGSELARRLKGRGSEDSAVQHRRLTNARREIAAASEFQYVIVNDSVEASVARVEAILLAESRQVARLPGLDEWIGRLTSELDEELGRTESAPQP